MLYKRHRRENEGIAVSRPVKIAPSILAADFRRLEAEVLAVQDAGADWIHCDIMDGVFVPNISFGPMVVEAVKKCVSIPLDVHLMIESPHKYIRQFCDAGADTLTVHADGCDDLPAVLEMVSAAGVRTGVTVNPDKPLSLFDRFLDKIDLVLIMSVYAGFGGQEFMPEVLEKVRILAALRDERGLDFDIEIDGGINDRTAVPALESGVNVLVSGSYVFNALDYREAMERLRRGPSSGRGERS